MPTLLHERRQEKEMKTDDYFEIKEHEPLDNDCICGYCINDLFIYFGLKKEPTCPHEDVWGLTTLDGVMCFLCGEKPAWNINGKKYKLEWSEVK